MSTPVRSQYLRIKQQFPDAILLFRMGDFFETFDDDAKVVARELEIALTSREMGRGQRVPLAGIPYHSLRMPGHLPVCANFLQPTGIARMVPVDLLLQLLAGQADLLGIDDNNIITNIHMRGKIFFVLPSYNLGNITS